VNNVPPLDLAKQYTLIGEEVNAAVLKVLASGRYIGGPIVEQFEQAFAQYIGVEHCVGCNSGTDALYLALRALNIGLGDEVITSPFTFVATAEMITAVGATPVFVDIDPTTFNLDVNQLEGAITPKTRAILPVHLFGHPVDMTRLITIAQSYNLIVIEDCAQATGARWDGQQVGSIGDVGCFSFFPTKNLGACGDGGAVTTNDPAIATRIRKLKEHGQPTRYYSDETGINSRLDAIQAAILQIKLPYLDYWNQQRAKIAQAYHQRLQQIPQIILPQAQDGGEAVWNQYTIRLCHEEGRKFPPDLLWRDWVREELQKLGIGSMVYYPLPLHLQPVYESLGYAPGTFPLAEKVAREVLSLPMFPELDSQQQERVIYALKDCLSQRLS